MFTIERYPDNPILSPDEKHSWEAEAAYNPSVAAEGGTVHVVYRAASAKRNIHGADLEVSTIGHATSRDGIRFGGREQIIRPEFDWEKFGCEDPRIAYFEGRYVIFYTALSTYPFAADGIKIAVALTEDFKTIEKHPVTPFNAKAMALFPERINGKIAALLTVHTDTPPVKICLAFFDKLEDIWSKEYWDAWYRDLDSHVLPIERGEHDHVELGSVPAKTSAGWLIFYSYIYNYFSPPPVFGVQALVLKADNPREIVGEVKRPFFVPTEDYELYGKVPNIVFPSGALVRKSEIYLYYGAADTTSCLAGIDLEEFLHELIAVRERQLERFDGNPILAPDKNHAWESKATFNAGALYSGKKAHILYRAMGDDNTSVVGYAASRDGFHIDERLPEPVYVPREDFEMKKVSGGNSGCEDPRLTEIGGTIYMCYTAFDGKDPPRVALTSITRKDFLARKWRWKKPILISPPGVDDKDAALFPKKISGKYAILHRMGVSIWLNFVDNLEFAGGKFLGGEVLLNPRETAWDSRRIGITGPPIETKAGWLLFYHGISRRTSHYNVRIALLDRKNPRKVLYRTYDTILEPSTSYEKEGIVPNVVFPCGIVEKGGKLFFYYGGADRVLAVATVQTEKLLEGILEEIETAKRNKTLVA